MLDSVKSLDPQLISSVEDSDLPRGIFEGGLHNEDGNGNTVPAGVVSYSVSEVLKTCTFKLRPEAKWSNGDPVTAADYVSGWQRLVDPALASEYAYYLELAQVVNAADITAGTKPVRYLSTGAIGTAFVDSALNRDYSEMMGVTLPVGALTIVVNLLYPWIDPKIRYWAVTLSTIDMGALSARLATPDEVKGRSLWADARRRFARNKAAVAGLSMLIFCLLFAVFGQALSPYTYDFTDFTIMGDAAELGAPSWARGYYFGTDDLGRDLFARTAMGTRISLIVGVVSSVIAVVVGTSWARWRAVSAGARTA